MTLLTLLTKPIRSFALVATNSSDAARRLCPGHGKPVAQPIPELATGIPVEGLVVTASRPAVARVVGIELALVGGHLLRSQECRRRRV